MMSFRRAQDPTSIAQLVGRMIRTPLARRVESDEVLNTVELYLPHYDAEALEGVLSRLRSPDAEEGLPTRVETSAVEYPRNANFTEVFTHLETLPNYSVERAPRMGDVKRALRLAGMLVHDGLSQNADDETRDLLTKKLKELRDIYAAKDVEWAKAVREGGEIEVDVTKVAIGQMNIIGTSGVRMFLSGENIDQLFDASGRMLAAGEGLHRTYWKRYHDHAKPNEAKLELFALMRQPETLAELEKLARQQFDELWKQYKNDIQKLPAAEKARFHSLSQASGKPSSHQWNLPLKIVEKKDGGSWTRHL
jgi:type III restriction enzyme